MSKQKDSKETKSKPELYTVLVAVFLASKLPPDNYKIDVWYDATTYNEIDTEKGTVSYSEKIDLSCGCCYEYEQREANIKDLDMLLQCEILIEMHERYCN